jgi:hypothetical protein
MLSDLDWDTWKIPAIIGGSLVALMLMVGGIGVAFQGGVKAEVIDLALVQEECDGLSDGLGSDGGINFACMTATFSSGYAVILRNTTSTPVYVSAEDIVGIGRGGKEYAADSVGECDIDPDETCDIMVSFSGTDEVKRIEVRSEKGTARVGSGDFGGKTEMQELMEGFTPAY